MYLSDPLCSITKCLKFFNFHDGGQCNVALQLTKLLLKKVTTTTSHLGFIKLKILRAVPFRDTLSILIPNFVATGHIFEELSRFFRFF